MSKLPSFKDLGRNGTFARTDAMRVRLEDIHVETGFNWRDKDLVDADGFTWADRIGQLAQHIAEGGMVPPLEVRVRAEGGVYLVDGHRRHEAYCLLDSQGKLPRVQGRNDTKPEAWINIVHFSGNDVERAKRILSSQRNEKLSPIELGRGFRVLQGFGVAITEIARCAGLSESTVRSHMTLAGANNDVQQMVRTREVKTTEAVKAVRQHGEKAGAVLRQAPLPSFKVGKLYALTAGLPEIGVEVAMVVNGKYAVLWLDRDSPDVECHWTDGNDEWNLHSPELKAWSPLPKIPEDKE